VKKSLILFGAALVFAVGAAAPKSVAKLGYDEAVFEDFAEPTLAEARGDAFRGYPPCRRRGQDRCIQTYERRVRAAMLPMNLPAMGGPYERVGPYPDCSRALTDECVQRFDRAPARSQPRRAPPRRPAPPRDLETPGI
jgi:hypothetical protein